MSYISDVPPAQTASAADIAERTRFAERNGTTPIGSPRPVQQQRVKQPAPDRRPSHRGGGRGRGDSRPNLSRAPLLRSMDKHQLARGKVGLPGRGSGGSSPFGLVRGGMADGTRHPFPPRPQTTVPQLPGQVYKETPSRPHGYGGSPHLHTVLPSPNAEDHITVRGSAGRKAPRQDAPSRQQPLLIARSVGPPTSGANITPLPFVRTSQIPTPSPPPNSSSQTPTPPPQIPTPSPEATTPPTAGKADKSLPRATPSVSGGGGAEPSSSMFTNQHRRRHDRRQAPILHNNGAVPKRSLLVNNRWKEWPEVGVLIGPGLETQFLVDLYEALKNYGEIERMEIFRNAREESEGKAKVFMRRVNRAFWESGRIRVRYGGDDEMLSQWVPVTLLEPTRNWMVASPMNPNKKFYERYTFPYEALDFGFMIEPQTMMVMHTAVGYGEPDPTSFEVDFWKKQLRIYFAVKFPKKPELVSEDSTSTANSNAGDDEETVAKNSTKTKHRVEMYRLEVPFAHMDHLVLMEGDDPKMKTIVIPLSSPPRYGRRAHDKTKSMDGDANFWTSNEIWMRQVAIESDMRHIRRLPISLSQKAPIIDIGRWTTFRMTLDLGEDGKEKMFKEMIDGLLDYNVDTKAFAPNAFNARFDKDSLRPIWDYLDRESDKQESVGTVSRYSSGLTELALPVLSFPVRYQLEVCISHELLNEYNITEEFVDRLMLMEEKQALSLLEHVAEKKMRYFNPMEIFDIPKREIRPGLSSRDLPEYCALMRRATVTPGGIILGTPSVETTNRVIRHYSSLGDHFLRVSFSDEKFFGRINGTEKDNLNEIFSRVFRTLKNGVTIGGRTFHFLAFGNSQLREHGAYFFAPSADVTPDDIRKWMGNFDDIRIVAKCASRLGQCFSTTRALNPSALQMEEIEDIERNGHCFSDGVGKISPLLAHMISWELKVPYDASCFQFRLGGNKGVLAVDVNMPDAYTTRAICTRPSQRKFESNHIGLEIVRCSQFASASLNRQLIVLMSSLGVPDEVFEDRLKLILEDYHLALEKPTKALELLTKHIDPNQKTLEIAQLVRSGFMEIKEPFVMSLMHLWRSWTIKYLKEKAKISLDQGAFVLGVVDETQELRGYYNTDDMATDLPEIFLQVTDNALFPEFDEEGKSVENDKRTRIITGEVLIARNPSLHPGDVRKVRAVDKPNLHHLVDVVVFPSTGDRPIPSMLSGGDLDGDDYIIIWDKDFVDHITNQKPASYVASPAPKLDRPVQISDISTFFVNYMKNDRLGTIANNHLAWADKSVEGVMSPQCLELAQIHSDAVDYPKSGVPAQMEKRLRCRAFPHFMEKDRDRSYTSSKVLGRLYDMVQRVDFLPCYHLPFSTRIIKAYPDLPEHMFVEMAELKAQYDAAVRRVLAQHDIKTETEIWSTFCLSHQGGKDYMFHEELGRIAQTLRDRFRAAVNAKCGDDSEARMVQRPKWVAAMYVVTARQVQEAKMALWKKQIMRRKGGEQGEVKSLRISKADAEKMPLMSFPWIFPEELCRILRNAGEREELGVEEMTMEEWQNVIFEVLEPDGSGGLRTKAPGTEEDEDDVEEIVGTAPTGVEEISDEEEDEGSSGDCASDEDNAEEYDEGENEDEDEQQLDEDANDTTLRAPSEPRSLSPETPTHAATPWRSGLLVDDSATNAVTSHAREDRYLDCANGRSSSVSSSVLEDLGQLVISGEAQSHSSTREGEGEGVGKEEEVSLLD